MPYGTPGPFCDNIATIITNEIANTFAGSYISVGYTNATTWNPANVSANITLSNGNLTAKQTANGGTLSSVLGVASHLTGQFYFEANADTLTGANMAIGVAVGLQPYLGNSLAGIGWYQNGSVLINNATVATIQTFAQGNNISCAVDFGNKTIWFRTGGGSWNNSGTANPATNTGGISISTLFAGPYFPGATTIALNDQITANFGRTTYSQTVPSGFTYW